MGKAALILFAASSLVGGLAIAGAIAAGTRHAVMVDRGSLYVYDRWSGNALRCDYYAVEQFTCARGHPN